MTGGVERVLRWVFILALAIAAPLLLAGLLTNSSRLLEAGVLTVMVTPLIGAVILAVALALARDWPFTAVALLVLAILTSSLYAAARLSSPSPAVTKHSSVVSQRFRGIRAPMHPGSLRSRRRSESGAACSSASLRAAGGSSTAYRTGTRWSSRLAIRAPRRSRCTRTSDSPHS